MVKKFFIYSLLILTALSMIAPFLIMLIISVSSNNQISYTDMGNFTQQLTFSNYTNVVNTIPVAKYFFNSLFVAIITTIGQIVISTLAGYAFARITFRGRNVVFFLILVTMFVPPQANIIPLFYLMKTLHLVDSYPALILPGIFGGFGIFMMRQAFLSFPKDLEDSSVIDGCNKFQLFYKIVCPLALPTIATLGIFTFISSWNSFIWPLIVTNSEGMRTLPLGLAIFKNSYREIIVWGDLLACSVICILPTIIVFLIGKNYIIKDMMQGAVKE